MNILITGGAGYIGSVTTRIFLEAGHTVSVLDNFSSSERFAVPTGVRCIKGSIGDFGKLVSRDDKFDAVIHLAGLISVAESMTKPELYWHNNVEQSLAMLSAMRTLEIKKVIFASTAAVYGNPDELPITEDARTQPTNTYGMTKLTIDMALTSEAWAHDLAATSVRFFNVAGAYNDAGELHKSESHLIPLAIAAADGKRDALSLFGIDYDTPDGTNVRDYIHVADLARAMLLALDKLTPGVHSIYNLGNGNGFTNRQVIDAVERVSGLTVPVIDAPRRSGDPARLIASSKKAFDELGWQPQVPALDDIVKDAWEFYKNKDTLSD